MNRAAPDATKRSNRRRRLIIQIPCLNEEQTLPETMAHLPRALEGFDEVKWLIIDDGSTDRTAEVARECGADYVLQLGYRQGLARAFSAGLEFCLKAGADVIVNTDADNQYCAEFIGDITQPIIDNSADIVIGVRPIFEIKGFPFWKKLLQRFGSWVVRVISGTEVPDAPSGFRAISSEAAIQLKVFNRYTYTLETIIQAGLKHTRIVSVPIKVNPATRPSRLISSTPVFVWRSAVTILRVFVIYAPLRFFMLLAAVALIPSVTIWIRFFYEYATGGGRGHIQSLILSAVLFGIAGVFALAGIVGDLMATNRMLLEEIRVMLIRRELCNTEQEQMTSQPTINGKNRG